MTTIRYCLFGVLCTAGLVFGLAASGVAASTAQSARGVVSTLDTRLLETMKNADSLGFSGRYRKLAPALDAAFDLPRIAKLALGDQWDALSAEQQQAYADKFRRDTIATYAQRFDGYDGQSFEITGTRDVAGGRRQVATHIVDGDERTPINYVLEQRDGDWRIVNVVSKGVSNLALKRGQYTGVIRKQGPKAFLDQFDRQLEKYPALPEG